MRTALLSAVLVGLGSACSSPAPRIPFRDTAWHASVLGGSWTINRFISEAEMVGVDLVLDEPGTGGWALELGARYANGDDDGTQTVFSPSGSFDQVADSKREIDLYEFALGVRQYFREGARLQPYFGVGGALMSAHTVEEWVQPIAPNFPVDTPVAEHNNSGLEAGIYMRTGLVWNVLRDQVREETEFPIGIDVRGLLGSEFSYLEISLGFGFGR